MGNVLTYLRWRSDFSFSDSKFCDVDNLILSLLSYVDFSDVVPADNRYISLSEAYEKLNTNGIVSSPAIPDCAELFQLMSESKRFGNSQLSMYQTKYDEKNATHFAAVKIKLSDESVYISFRGTDDSIAGWQEDFCIGSQIVPSQQIAVQYLQNAAEDKITRVGGHSKGGNLAMYAAMNCDESTRLKIAAVYNNDGPGFSKDVIALDQYAKIDDKLIWIVPGFSVVGTLFAYNPPTLIVQSSANGFAQHNGFSWQVEGSHFCERVSPEPESEFFVQTFDTWLNSASISQRETFTREFFGALRSGGAKSIGSMRQDGIDGYGTILLSIAKSESRTKIVIGKFIVSFIQNCHSINLKEAIKYINTTINNLQTLIKQSQNNPSV